MESRNALFIAITLRRILCLSKTSHLHSAPTSAESSAAPPGAPLGLHLRTQNLAVGGEQLMQQGGVSLWMKIVHRQSDASPRVRSIW